jgi:hypothetical protein
VSFLCFLVVKKLPKDLADDCYRFLRPYDKLFIRFLIRGIKSVLD